MENQQRSWEDWATETFVGSNYYYYKTKWEHQTPDRSFTSWNWAAFFVPFYWMIYRKMYLYAFLFFIASIVGTIFPIGLIFHCLVGVFANYLYLKTCNTTIKTASQYNNENAMTYIKKKGGTNGLGVILTIVSIFVVSIMIFLGIILLADNSDTASVSNQNTYDAISVNKDIIVTAPYSYKQQENETYDIYLYNNIKDSEFLFKVYYKDDYQDTINEQYFIDETKEFFELKYSLTPVNNKEMLTLDHQAPQTLYCATIDSNIFYFYFTCEKFDKYYVLTTFTVKPSDWDRVKEKISDTISSVRPNDTL
jgi:uncharacterized membrane protein